MDAAHEHADDDDADPEVTAITRKFEESHDTLGAINDLQQLLIERTGQIPIVQVPPLAAATASTEPIAEAEAPFRPEEAGPEAASEAALAPGESGAAAAAEPAGSQPADLAADSDEERFTPVIDWALTPVPEPANAPGFSPWVDPAQIAAARDDAPAPSSSDVSTQVFSVFAAKPETPSVPDAPHVLTGAPAEPASSTEPALNTAPEALPPVVPLIDAVPDELATEPAPAVEASAPLLNATGSIDVTPRLERADLDEDDDVIDDTDRVDRAVHTTARPAETAPPPPAWDLTFDKVVAAPTAPVAGAPVPASAAAPVVAPAPIAPPVQTAAEPAQQPTRRRWWPFGRR
jgi:hypothetical protein